jgi:hypothetical protein
VRLHVTRDDQNSNRFSTYIYGEYDSTTNVKRKDERSDDGKKKGVTREKEER